MGPQQAQEFTRLVEANEKRWLDTLFWKVGHREEARDLLQDVLCEVCGDPDFDPARREAGGYIAGLLQWRVQDHLRRRGRRPAPLARPLPEDGPTALDHLLDRREPSPPDALQTEEGRRALRAAIARLPAAQQGVVLLYLSGLSRQEIAGAAGITFHSANMHLHRAWAALRQALGESPLP
jgi:RNA polymerase sigma-70 factor (ECF subfamily)